MHQQRSQERRQPQNPHFGSCNKRKQPYGISKLKLQGLKWTKALSAKEFLDRLCSQRQVSATRNVRTRARAAIMEAPDHQVFGNTQGASKPKSVTIQTCSSEKLNRHGQKMKKPRWVASARNAGTGLSKTSSLDLLAPSQSAKFFHLCHRCNSGIANTRIANSRSCCQQSGVRSKGPASRVPTKKWTEQSNHRHQQAPTSCTQTLCQRSAQTRCFLRILVENSWTQPL